MINTKLKAENVFRLGGKTDAINLVNLDGETVAAFSSAAFFYIVTGFKSAEAYNEHHDDEPVKFLVWKREH